MNKPLDLIPQTPTVSAVDAVTAALPPRKETLTPWGGPFPELASVRRPRYRPDTENAWGRSTNLLPNGQEPELARVVLDVSEPLTVSVDVIEPPGLDGDSSKALTVWAEITFGNGSTSVTRQIRCDYRFDVTLVASYVSVRVYIGLPDSSKVFIQNPILPGQQTAQVCAQVARGIRGLPYVCTQFVTADITGQANMVAEPCRILSVEAHLGAAAGGQRFLQLYDTAGATIPGATPPTVEYPLGTTPAPGVILTRFLNPRGFSQGVAAGVSSTSGSFSFVAEDFHIELERLLL